MPNTASLIAETADECLDGRGFDSIRGLKAYTDDVRMAATMYYGIGTHMRSARSQNGKGHLLGHACDLGFSTTDGSARIY